ncbi:MAG: hypothetical protein M3300_14035 [Actinomycetota bacterium]|nr:hypothetical protein [Actinomycetota bacterium]
MRVLFVDAGIAVLATVLRWSKSADVQFGEIDHVPAALDVTRHDQPGGGSGLPSLAKSREISP